MAREWVIDGYTGYEGLRLQDCEVEEPGPTEVRLRVEAFALNWGDADLMRDLYSFSFSSMPARVGIEAAGIVEVTGSEVTGVEVGARYCTLPYFYDKRGTSADTVIIDQAYITKAPENLTAVESSSIWMQFMTAYYPMVEFAKAAPGRNIFVPAGTSTAGTAAIQMAKMQGATVISSTRSEANRQILLGLGADHVYVDDGGDLAAYLLDVTDGTGPDASFDPVGGEFMQRYTAAMAKHGQLFMYGLLSGSFPDLPYVDMFQRCLWFHAYSVFNYVEDADACRRGTDFIYDCLVNGTLQPTVDRVFPMEGYIEAWDYLKGDRSSYGKVMVETGA